MNNFKSSIIVIFFLYLTFPSVSNAQLKYDILSLHFKNGLNHYYDSNLEDSFNEFNTILSAFYDEASISYNSNVLANLENAINIEDIRLNAKLVLDTLNGDKRYINLLSQTYMLISWCYEVNKSYLNSANFMELSIFFAEQELHLINSETEKEKAINNMQSLVEHYIMSVYYGNNGEESYKKYIMSALAISDRFRGQNLSKLLSNTDSELLYNSVFVTQRFSNDLGADYLNYEVESNLKSLRFHNSGLLYYHYTEYGLFYWIYSKNGGLSYGKSEITLKTLKASVDALIHSIENDNIESQDIILKFISYELLPRTLRLHANYINELVIIPHGILNKVPFGLLKFNELNKTLSDIFSLRFSPSINLLKNLEFNINLKIVERLMVNKNILNDKILDSLFNKHQIEDDIESQISFFHRNPKFLIDSVLIVSNPPMPFIPHIENETPIRLSPMSFAETTDDIIKGILRQRRLINDKLNSESQIIKNISNYSLIHFSTHSKSFESKEQVKNSYIALAPDSINDGLLTLAELLSESFPSLNTELMVISACSTATGEYNYVEGSIGLQWAFLTRGVNRLVTTLWDVDDKATNYFMKRFYSHWLEDIDLPPLSEALRRAQLDLREKNEYKKTKYWAAFQLYGAK